MHFAYVAEEVFLHHRADEMTNLGQDASCGLRRNAEYFLSKAARKILQTKTVNGLNSHFAKVRLWAEETARASPHAVLDRH